MSLNGKQVAHLAAELAESWREEHDEQAEAARVLDQLAETFSEHAGLDDQACLALLRQLEVENAAEWELINELRCAIESRVWSRHPSRHNPGRPLRSRR